MVAAACDDAPMPLMHGAEPFHHEGGRIGVLLVHGFTGTPQSLRGWGEALAAADLSVALPRLPGHGTTVAEANPNVPVYIYEGAGHGFNNESPERYNAPAADLARHRTLELFDGA